MTHWTDSLPSDACKPAVDWCRTMPDFATAWQSCQVGGWMEWLLNRLDAWPSGVWAEYCRVTTPACAEFDRVSATALAEYRRATATAGVETAGADYDRTTATAGAEYDRVRADYLRPYMPKLAQD